MLRCCLGVSFSSAVVRSSILSMPAGRFLSSSVDGAAAVDAAEPVVAAGPVLTVVPESVLLFETRKYMFPFRHKDSISGGQKVILTVNVRDLPLTTEEEISRLITMTGNRFNLDTGRLTLISEKYDTPDLNRRYLRNLIDTLVTAAQGRLPADFPPVTAQRVDDVTA